MAQLLFGRTDNIKRYTRGPFSFKAKQVAKGRINRRQNSTPSEPAERQGQESLKWCYFAESSMASPSRHDPGRERTFRSHYRAWSRPRMVPAFRAYRRTHWCE